MAEDKLLIGYYRLSMEDNSTQRESNSITNQRLLIKDYIQSDTELSGMKFQELYDDGYSGATLNRPAMQELIQLVRQEKVSCIVVKDFSRFSRDYIELGTYLEQIFPFMGIRFISVSDHYDSRDYQGRTLGMDAQFKGLLADFYVKDQSKKVKTALEMKREKGQYCCGAAPFGYRKNPKDKNQLQIVEEEAQVIRRVFDLTLQRYSKMDICRLFNEEGIKTPLQYMRKRQKENKNPLEERNQQWTPDMVRKIINNKNYYGCMVYGKTTIRDPGSDKEILVPENQWKVLEGHHESIISKEVFDQAQALQIRHTKVARHHKSDHILNGYVKCGNCHRNLSLSHEHKGHGYYSCVYAKGTDQTGCFSGKLDNRILEQLLIADWKREVQSQITQAQMKEEYRAEIEKCKAEMGRLEQKIEEGRIENSWNYENYHDGILAKEEFQRLRKELEQKREQRQEEIQKLKERITLKQELLERKYMPQEDLMKYQSYDQIDRELVEQNLEAVYVYDDGKIEICWKGDNLVAIT